MKTIFFVMMIIFLTSIHMLGCEDRDDSSSGNNAGGDTSSETNSGTQSGTSSEANAPMITCTDVVPCENLSCPEEYQPPYTCIWISTCDDSKSEVAMCVTDEQACMLECGHTNCTILDSMPGIPDCGDY